MRRSSVAGLTASSAFPTIAVAFAIGSWGFGSVLVKLMSISGVSLAFYRLWLGSALMLVIVTLGRRRLTLDVVRRAVPAGLLFGVNVAMFFSGLRLTSVANANLISALQPAIVLMVAGPLFGEHVGRREVAWTAVSLAGVGVVIVGGSSSPAWSPAGDLLAFGAVLTFTGYFLVSKRARQTVGTLEYVAVVQLIAAIVVTPIVLLSPGGIEWLEPLDALWLALIVFGTGVGAHLVVNWGHRYVNVSASSLMMLGVPVVAAVAAWLVLDESITPLQIAGSAVTLGAILFIVLGGDTPPASEPAAAVDPLLGET